MESLHAILLRKIWAATTNESRIGSSIEGEITVGVISTLPVESPRLLEKCSQLGWYYETAKVEAYDNSSTCF